MFLVGFMEDKSACSRKLCEVSKFHSVSDTSPLVYIVTKRELLCRARTDRRSI